MKLLIWMSRISSSPRRLTWVPGVRHQFQSSGCRLLEGCSMAEAGTFLRGCETFPADNQACGTRDARSDRRQPLTPR